MKKIHFFLESAPVPPVVLLRLTRPVPPVQIAGMIDGPAVRLHQKGHARIGGQQRLHMDAIHIQILMGCHEMYLLRSLPPAAALPDIVRQNIVYIHATTLQLKNLPGIMIPMRVRSKNIQSKFPKFKMRLTR